jgi:co-chaperonin GroES (HSP10)
VVRQMAAKAERSLRLPSSSCGQRVGAVLLMRSARGSRRSAEATSLSERRLKAKFREREDSPAPGSPTWRSCVGRLMACPVGKSDTVFAVGYVGGAPSGSDAAYAGGTDAFLARIAANGDLTSLTLWGDEDDQRARDVVVDSEGNVIVVGDFRGKIVFGQTTLESAGGADGYVVKLNDRGDIVFARAVAGPGDATLRAVSVDSRDNIFVIGDFEQTVSLGGPRTSAGENDLLIAEFDPEGAVIAVSTFGDDKPQAAVDIAVGVGDVVYFLGEIRGAPKFGADPLEGMSPSYDLVFGKLTR